MKEKCIFLFITFAFFNTNIFSQQEESPIKIFGYFQTSFSHEDDIIVEKTDKNSFNVQQLNLILQKDLAKNWTSFINLEFLNSFSSGKNWGEFNLAEAWVRYRFGKKLNIKLGLQTPIFNNLNEINNKTPILAYIIRPLAYETSFREFISVEEFVPSRTFFQAYGYLYLDDFKLDYSMHLGNSPNISTRNDIGKSSGSDTTNTFLIGGRIGLRHSNFKVGISATRDKINYKYNRNLTNEFVEEISRIRLGSDISFNIDDFSFEAELIKVIYNDNNEELLFDKNFYYATLGYQVSNNVNVFASYWYSKEKKNGIGLIQDFIAYSEMNIPNIGITYDFNNRIRVKGQFARGKIELENLHENSYEFNFYAAAISVFF